MVKASSSASASLKDYLKRYVDKDVEDKKKNKKKKKVKAEPLGVRVVDEDPVWAKPMKPEEDDNDSEDEEKPVVDEDIEVKRMKRLELLRSKRPFGAISEDGSGWVSVSDTPNLSNTKDETPDISPPRRNRIRNDTPEPNEQKPDMSPPRKRRARNDTPSPEPNVRDVIADLSPPRKQKLHNNRSPKPEKSRDLDISPPRRVRRGIVNEDDTQVNKGGDLSPPRKGRGDLSLPRKGRGDLSPPRKGRADRIQQTRHGSTEIDVPRTSISRDLSPPRSVKKEPSKEQRRTGLISKHDIREEHDRVTKAVWQSFEEMDPEDTGRGAAGVYRDKVTGKKISKEEFMKSKKKEKPKEIKLEWGKGLAQKREAEERQQELELEKEKPFARTRDDADLDKMLKDRLRWGDPMAHLVKKKQFEPVLPDLGDNENMKKSGFVIPQDVPSHSWLRRGLDAAPNRYGIKPGRHWDGVDRSTGYEKDLFTRSNEKQATEKEAYLWSVADM